MQKVNGQSQRWSTIKVNVGQRSKSMVNSQGQGSTRADVALADVAVKKSGAWGRVQESGGAPDLQAAHEGVSSV